MPSLSDLKTQSLLEALLEEMRAIRKLLEEGRGGPLPTIPEITPYIPGQPSLFEPEESCPVCGIVISKVMSYACQHLECPTGLGPTTC